MIDAADLEQMRADAELLRDDNPRTITIRRGAGALAEQSVRVVQPRRGSVMLGQDSKVTLGSLIVLGDQNLLIQPLDRFTLDGALYRVVFVDPDRRAGTIAQCTMEA